MASRPFFDDLKSASSGAVVTNPTMTSNVTSYINSTCSGAIVTLNGFQAIFLACQHDVNSVSIEGMN